MRETRISIIGTRVTRLPESNTESILSNVRERIDNVGRDNPDIILLPEAFANLPKGDDMQATMDVAQTVPGPISEELSALARKYRTYIAFGLIRKDGCKLYNSLVLMDRDGNHVWTYDKATPVPHEILSWGITPGGSPESYQCDFGRIGGAICFDINFLELAELYFRQDVELLLFSSAFPGGRLLDIWATRYGFAVAGSTYNDQNRIIDCTGSTMCRTSDHIPGATAVLNLNRRVVHMDGNMEKLDVMHTRYAGDVLIEDMREEATCVITSLKPGLEVAELIREFGIERLPDYFDRVRKVRKEYGGL